MINCGYCDYNKGYLLGIRKQNRCEDESMVSDSCLFDTGVACR